MQNASGHPSLLHPLLSSSLQVLPTLPVQLLLQLLFLLLKKHWTGVAPERLQFKLQKTCEALDSNVQQFTVSTIKKLIAVFEAVMMDFQQKHTTSI